VLERGKVRAVASLHRNFPRHLTVAAVLEMVALMTPAVVLGWFWSVADVGLYGQAYGLLNLPLGLFLDAVGRTFYPHLAQLHHRGASLAPQMKRMLTLLADLGCYPLGAVVVCGPALFGVALGPAFRESGGLARLMVPMFLPWLMWSPLSSAVNVLGLQRPFLRRVAALTATRVAVLVAVPLAGGSMALTIGAWAGCAGALMVAQLAWILRTCGVPLREAARIVGARCLAAAIALAPAAAAAPLGVAWQAAALAAGAVAYALWALRASPDLARRLTHRLPAFGRALR
jgi:O-antigen/teichoic acid export membrane protein